MDDIAAGFGDVLYGLLSKSMIRSGSPPLLLVPAQQGVFEPLYLGHDPSFQGFGAVHPFARQIEQVGIRLGNGGQGLIIGARHDAGLVRLTPLLFQVIHTAVEFEVETAHGCSWAWVMSRCCLANMTVSRQLCGSSFKAWATPGEIDADRYRRRIGGAPGPAPETAMLLPCLCRRRPAARTAQPGIGGHGNVLYAGGPEEGRGRSKDLPADAFDQILLQGLPRLAPHFA